MFALTGQEVGAATVLQDRGDLAEKAGRLQDAYDLYMQALEIYEKARANIGIANIHLRVGNLHLLARRPADAGERDTAAQTEFAKALELFRAEGSDLGTANVLRSQGDLLRYQGRVDDARGAYAQAVRLFQNEGDPLGVANTHRALGEIAFDLKDWSTANAEYLEARENVRAGSNTDGPGADVRATGADRREDERSRGPRSIPPRSVRSSGGKRGSSRRAVRRQRACEHRRRGLRHSWRLIRGTRAQLDMRYQPSRVPLPRWSSTARKPSIQQRAVGRGDWHDVFASWKRWIRIGIAANRTVSGAA